MTLGVSNLPGANGALGASHLSENGATAARNFLDALLGQERAPRSGGQAFLADVKETRNPDEKRALIDGFAEGFAAASQGAASEGATSEDTSPARNAGRGERSGSAGGAREAAATGGAEGDAPASPQDLMSGFQEIADRVADSALPKGAKNALLDGIAELMSKLKAEAPAGGSAGGSKGSCANGAPGGSGSAGGSAPTAQNAPRPDESSAQATGNSGVWSHEVKDGEATIQLGDKYTVKANEKDASWTVTNNETGKTTKVWGDPHVDKDGDGKTDFDFKKDTTFQLDDGTKITVGTVPGGENGTTFSSKLTITNGDNAIQVTGLGDTHDGANNLEVKQSNAGRTLDDLEHDGALTIYEDGGAWQTRDGKPVDQSVVDAAEAAA